MMAFIQSTRVNNSSYIEHMFLNRRTIESLLLTHADKI